MSPLRLYKLLLTRPEGFHNGAGAARASGASEWRDVETGRCRNVR